MAFYPPNCATRTHTFFSKEPDFGDYHKSSTGTWRRCSLQPCSHRNLAEVPPPTGGAIPVVPTESPSEPNNFVTLAQWSFVNEGPFAHQIYHHWAPEATSCLGYPHCFDAEDFIDRARLWNDDGWNPCAYQPCVNRWLSILIKDQLPDVFVLTEPAQANLIREAIGKEFNPVALPPPSRIPTPAPVERKASTSTGPVKTEPPAAAGSSSRTPASKPPAQPAGLQPPTDPRPKPSATPTRPSPRPPPPPPNPPTDTAPAMSADTKANKPEEFTGKRERTQGFINSLELYFLANSSSISSDQAKVLCALSYIKGDAQYFVDRTLQQATDRGGSYPTWIELRTSLRTTFGVVEKSIEAMAKLQSLNFQALGPESFADAFRVHAKAAGIDNLAILNILQQRVPRALTEKMFANPSMPTAWGDWLDMAMTLDRQYRNIRLLLGNRNPNQQRRRQGVRTTSSATTVNAVNNRPPLPKLTQQERERCIREGRCFRCRQTGHRSGDNSCQGGTTRPANRDVRAIKATTSTPSLTTTTPLAKTSSNLTQAVNAINALSSESDRAELLAMISKGF